MKIRLIPVNFIRNDPGRTEGVGWLNPLWITAIDDLKGDGTWRVWWHQATRIADFYYVTAEEAQRLIKLLTESDDQ